MKTLTRTAFGGAVLAVSLALAAVPVMAGSLEEPAAEPAIAAPAPIVIETGADWTGPYVAGHLGYGDASADLGSGLGDIDGNDMLYGLGVGYDWDFGTWVAGAALEWDMLDIDLGPGAGGLDDVFRLKARAGADLGQTLVYLAAGAAQADGDLAGNSASDTGWFGGFGAEYAISEDWTVGGEVLGYRFSDFDSSGVDIDATTAALTVGFRF